MATKLKDLRDSLTTELEALTPALDTTTPFRAANGRNIGEASARSMHRVFWFDPIGGGDIRDYAPSAMSIVRHQMALSIAHNGSRYTIEQMLEYRVTDAIQVIRAINNYTSLPTGVTYCRALGYEIELDQSDSAIIVIQVEAETQETD